MLQDVRYGWRQLRREKGFTLVVVLSLALGIGANTAIFTLTNAVMIKRLPVMDPDQLVLLNWTAAKGLSVIQTGRSGRDSAGRTVNPSFSYADFEAFAARHDGLSTIFAFAPLLRVSAIVDRQPDLIDGEMVSGAYFEGLGVVPLAGRAINDGDLKPGAPRVAVISHASWMRRFGSDATVIGNVITLNQLDFTIVGIAPAEFFGVEAGRAPELWIPLAEYPGLNPWGVHPRQGASMFAERNWWWLMLMGRRVPGTSDAQINAMLDVVFQQNLAATVNPLPPPDERPHLQIVPADRGLMLLTARISRPLFILTTVVGVVLAVACANVATLLLARSTRRRREVAVRFAMGASRASVIRQLLTESIMLAGIGGALGLLCAYWASGALLALFSGGPEPMPLDVRVDSTVLGFSLAISLLTGVIFGLAPAFRATRVDLSTALKESTSSIANEGVRGRAGLGRLLVIGQVALTLILLIGAGLFLRTLQNLQHERLGFNRENLLLFRVDAAQSGYAGVLLTGFYRDLRDRLQILAGVRSVSLSSERLVSGSRNAGFMAADERIGSSQNRVLVHWNTVGPRFAETLGIRLLQGRDIDGRDTEQSVKVALINHAMARTFWSDVNAIGRTFRFTGSYAHDRFEVVGIVDDAKYDSLRDAPPPTAYLPFTQSPVPVGSMHVEVRTAGEPLALLPSVRQAVQSLEPTLPLTDVTTQALQIERTLSQEHLLAKLSSVFGLLALLLACIGLYGTLAYAVSRRHNEIGVRIALGATRGTIVGMFLRQALVLVGTGAVVGIIGGLIATKLVGATLYGLSPTDPATIASAAVLLVAITALAAYLPAYRASRVDPMTVLRRE